MINLTDDAKTHLNNYLQEVRTCLKVCSSVDADEVEQNIKEHIESELQDSSESISYDVLDEVLKKLGSPQQWVPKDDLVWWRKIILRLRKGPEDWRLAYISLGLLILSFLAGRIFFMIFVLASFIISRAVISTVDQTNQLKGQKWLIYPSLLVVYLFIGFWLLAWPFALLFAIAAGCERATSANKDMFPWSTGNETPYWTLAFIFFAGVTFLWWSILAVVHKKAPQLLGVVFRPFAEKIKPKSINWFIGIMAGLAVICLVTIILMIKYQGWSTYFIKIFG